MILRLADPREEFIIQFVFYLATSVLGTAVHFLTLYFAVAKLSLDPVLMSTCGAIIGAAIIYCLNYFFVFQSKAPHKKTAVRFCLVACCNVALNALILKILIFVCNWHYMALQAVTTTIVFMLTFALNRGWTFGVQSQE